MNAMVSLLCVAGGALGALLLSTLLPQKHRSHTHLLLTCLIAVICADVLLAAALHLSPPMQNSVLARMSGFPGLLFAPLLYLYFRTQASSCGLHVSDISHFSGYMLLQLIALFEFAEPGVLPWLTIQSYMNLASLLMMSMYMMAAIRIIPATALQQQCTVFHHGRLAVTALLAVQATYLLSTACSGISSRSGVVTGDITDALLSCSLTVLACSALYRILTRERHDDTHVIHLAQAKREPDKQKYGNNRLPDFVREPIVNQLNEYMESARPWLKIDLTLSQLAASINVNPHHLSQIINSEFGKSFACYINEYRVNAACRLLSDANNRTVLDIAMDSGFSSKSSFNALFKKHTGLTPSEYRKKFQKNDYLVA